MGGKNRPQPPRKMTLNLTKIAADFDRFCAEAHGGPGVVT
jgi:hypothetical protein